jgi:prepilin-type processing-associated H-X9-DG protein
MLFSIILGIAVLLLLVHGLLRGSTGMQLFCGFIVLSLLASLIPWQSPGIARDRARRVHCMNNLRQIALATIAFRDDHTNAFPQSLLNLTNAFPYPQGYVCKSTKHVPGNLADVTKWTDYHFISPPGSNNVLAYCPPENHKGKGGNIVYADASVQWCTPEEFTNALEHGRRGAPTTPPVPSPAPSAGEVW